MIVSIMVDLWLHHTVCFSLNLVFLLNLQIMVDIQGLKIKEALLCLAVLQPQLLHQNLCFLEHLLLCITFMIVFMQIRKGG
jgi:hypothetical protein